MNRFLNRVYSTAIILAMAVIFSACAATNEEALIEPEGAGFQFLFLGDTQEDPDEPALYTAFNNLITSAYEMADNPELVLIAGDLINDGDDASEWDEFFSASEDYFEKMLPIVCVGNHDDTDLQAEYFPLDSTLGFVGDNSFYSIDYENVHFVVMDSNLMGGEPAEIVQWLEDDLANASSDWIVVMYHHPTYEAMEIPKDSTRAETIRENYVPIFEEYGVDLVLCGHQHTYMRSQTIDGIVYIMGNASAKGYTAQDFDYIDTSWDGGSVYSIFDVTDASISCNTYNLSGEVIDSFAIEK